MAKEFPREMRVGDDDDFGEAIRYLLDNPSLRPELIIWEGNKRGVLRIDEHWDTPAECRGLLICRQLTGAVVSYDIALNFGRDHYRLSIGSRYYHSFDSEYFKEYLE
jgi:hypothetical protein